MQWIGQYILDTFVNQPNVKVIHLGDHADMPSLSAYSAKGSKSMEGRRYRADIDAANAAFDVLCGPWEHHNSKRKGRRRKECHPELHILLGNHEDRIARAQEQDPQLSGVISLTDLNYADHGFEVHDYLDPVYIDGVGYCHYWFQPMTGRPYSGTIENRLKTIGHSFVMGHQQTLLYGIRYVAGRSQHGLVCGACYLHAEDYKGGVQGNAHWRGIAILRNVRDGSYDPEFVSLESLCLRYTGKKLRDLLPSYTWL